MSETSKKTTRARSASTTPEAKSGVKTTSEGRTTRKATATTKSVAPQRPAVKATAAQAVDAKKTPKTPKTAKTTGAATSTTAPSVAKKETPPRARVKKADVAQASETTTPTVTLKNVTAKAMSAEQAKAVEDAQAQRAKTHPAVAIEGNAWVGVLDKKKGPNLAVPVDLTKTGISTFMTLGEFAKRYPELVIPIYQRVDGWRAQQKGAFKLAIEALANAKKPVPLFIGTLSLATDNQDRTVVIDGQQRLLALSALTAGLIRLVRENVVGTKAVEDPLLLSADVVKGLDRVSENVVFVVHHYGHVNFERQITAFNDLNRYEEPYRLSDLFRSAMLSALAPKDHEAFAREYDRAWRLATVLYRLANHEDYLLSLDLDDTEAPVERPSLFRLPSASEIEARLAPAGTPRPYIPEQKTPNEALLPLPDDLALVERENTPDEDDDAPLVSVRERAVRQASIAELMTTFLDHVNANDTLELGDFLAKDRVFDAKRELDYAEHLSTRAKLFHFLCYLRAANPLGRVPVAWGDAFGRWRGGGLEKLLPVGADGRVAMRDAQRVLARLTANNAWTEALLRQYRATDKPGKLKGTVRDTWLAYMRLLGDGWLQLSHPGEATLATLMMEAPGFVSAAPHASLWQALERWASLTKGDGDARRLSSRARECLLYRDLIEGGSRITRALEVAIERSTATTDAPEAGAVPLKGALGLTSKRTASTVAKALVAFMTEGFTARQLPGADNATAEVPWVSRNFVGLTGRVSQSVVASWANQLYLAEETAAILGDTPPDFKAVILASRLSQEGLWPRALLWVGLTREMRADRDAKLLIATVALMETFWQAFLSESV